MVVNDPDGLKVAVCGNWAHSFQAHGLKRFYKRTDERLVIFRLGWLGQHVIQSNVVDRRPGLINESGRLIGNYLRIGDDRRNFGPVSNHALVLTKLVK